jgi:peroxiredoxin
MKNLNCLFASLLIPTIIGCTHSNPKPPELPKSFELTATKMENSTDSSFHIYMTTFNENGPRSVLYPKFKGIPDSLSKIKKYILCLDDVQAVFQAYKAGLINKNDCVSYLRNRATDTIQCTGNYVKTFIMFVTGFSKKREKYYVFDYNNNYNLSDDPLFILKGKNLDNQIHKVIFERYINGTITLDSTWIGLSEINKTDWLGIKFYEQTVSTFTFDSVRYKLLAYPTYETGVNYGNEVIFELSDTLQKAIQVFGHDQYAKLKNLYYQVTCNTDGRTISLKLDPNALEKGSTQVNMPAVPFKAVTLKGDTIMFPKDFKGIYVLLDFWSTSCPHCIDDIRNSYRNLYKKYAGDKFEIVGIADDPKSKIEKFISQNMITWTMIPAPKSFIQGLYRIDSYPALYLIGPDGVIKAKGKELVKEKINAVIEKYLGNY